MSLPFCQHGRSDREGCRLPSGSSEHGEGSCQCSHFWRGHGLRAPFPDDMEKLPPPLLLVPSPCNQASEKKAAPFLLGLTSLFQQSDLSSYHRDTVLRLPGPHAHPLLTGGPLAFLRYPSLLYYHWSGPHVCLREQRRLLLPARMGNRSQAGFSLLANRTKAENKMMSVCAVTLF